MSRILAAMILFLTALASALVSAQACAQEPIPGIGPRGEPVKRHTGFKFTEGPAADKDGNVYFTDIPNNRIHKSSVDGTLSTFLEDSQATNGLMFDAAGRLLGCQGKLRRLVAIDVSSKKITELAGDMNVPNDLVIDKTGGVYVTDPDIKSVHYVPREGNSGGKGEGKAKKIITDLPRPNGVLLSPDEKTLYVLPSGSAKVMAYPIESPGSIGPGKVFFTLAENPKNPGRPGGDGLTVDSRGNLYLTRPSMKMIQVVDPAGKELGRIPLPEEPSNCTFGGADMKTLFVTAQTSLYTIPMDAVGHRFAK